ncbi:hypothetical protein EV121DRAFT_213990 [Schizophyllum commune]
MQGRLFPPIDDRRGYEGKYEDDPLGEELGEESRVWRVLLDEGSKRDAKAFQGLRDHLDVDLVFSGLFAAVVTTFVVQLSQSLQPDYAEINAALLVEMVAVQRAMAKGESVDDVRRSKLGPGDVTASGLDYWASRFWYLSLLLGLFAAFLAFIAYDSDVYGSPKRRALVRHYRRIGLERWHVGLIVLILPTLLHASMLLFFIGLTLYIRRFDTPMAYLAIAFTGTFYSLYLLSVCMPLFFPRCPYRSPLSEWAYRVRLAFDWLRLLSSDSEGQPFPKTMAEREEHEVAESQDILVFDSLDLTVRESSGLSVTPLIVQATFSLPFVPHASSFADLPYGHLLRDRMLPWFFNSLDTRRAVLNWRPGRENAIQRMACCLLLVPTGSVHSGAVDRDRYCACASRILHALVLAVRWHDVAEASVPSLSATIFALCAKLKSFNAPTIDLDQVLQERTSEALLDKPPHARLRLHASIWQGMLEFLAYHYREYTMRLSAEFVVLLWHSLGSAEPLDGCRDDIERMRRSVSQSPTMTLGEYILIMPSSHSRILEDTMYSPLDKETQSEVCDSSSSDESTTSSSTTFLFRRKPITLLIACRAIEIHAGKSVENMRFDDNFVFFAKQFLTSVFHDYDLIRKGKRGVLWTFHSIISSDTSRSLAGSVSLFSNAISDTLAQPLFWFLVKMMADMHYHQTLYTGSGPNIIEILRAMVHLATRNRITLDAQIPDDEDSLYILFPTAWVVLDDAEAVCSDLMDVLIALLSRRLKQLADEQDAMETERERSGLAETVKWCLWVDLVSAARTSLTRSTATYPDASGALHEALMSLSERHRETWRRSVSAYLRDVPLPISVGMALNNVRSRKALAELLNGKPSVRGKSLSAPDVLPPMVCIPVDAREGPGMIDWYVYHIL